MAWLGLYMTTIYAFLGLDIYKDYIILSPSKILSIYRVVEQKVPVYSSYICGKYISPINLGPIQIEYLLVLVAQKLPQL